MPKLPVVPICRIGARLRRRANHGDALAHPASMKRDVSADRHDTWGGDAVAALATRMFVMWTNGAGADGEVVWSWHPDADAKLRGYEPRCDRGKKARSLGRARRTPLKPSCREGRDASAKPVVTAACVFCLQAGHGRGQRPAFPAPSSIVEGDVLAKPGRFSAAGRHIGCLKFESEIAGSSLRGATCSPTCRHGATVLRSS